MKEPATASKSPQLGLEEILTALSKVTAVIDAEDVAMYRTQAAQFAERLSWAPAIGNGTAIVALAGIVGNVPSPDAALSALTWPLATFSAGLACGLCSIFLTGQVLDLVSTSQNTHNRIKSGLLDVVNRGKALTEGVTSQNAAERIREADLLLPKAEKLVAGHHKLERRLKRGKLRSVTASILNGAAVFTVALGLAILLVGHSTGQLRLERPQQSPTEKSTSVGEDARPKGIVTFKADTNGSVWKVDADSVRGSRKQRQGWVVIDTSKDKTVTYREERLLYQVDCDTTAALELSKATYDRDGRTLTGESVSPEKAKVQYWPPNTFGTKVVNFICDPKFDGPHS